MVVGGGGGWFFVDEGWECGDAGRDRVGNRALGTMVTAMTLSRSVVMKRKASRSHAK